MSGETDLQTILRSLRPVLDPCRYVFASFPDMTIAETERFEPVALFQEQEGLSVIVEDRFLADHVAPETPRFRKISLDVHSSLEAVGLTAALSQALAEAGISANVVAATYHDHIFVPDSRCDEAMKVIRDLSQR